MRAAGTRVVGIEVDASGPNVGAGARGGHHRRDQRRAGRGGALEIPHPTRPPARRLRRRHDQSRGARPSAGAGRGAQGRGPRLPRALDRSRGVRAARSSMRWIGARGQVPGRLLQLLRPSGAVPAPRQPPDAAAVIVVGSGPLAASVVQHTAALMATARSQASSSLLVVAPDATRRVEALATRHPSIARLADLRPVDAGLDPVALRSAPILPMGGSGAVVYLCDTRNDVNVAASPRAQAGGALVEVAGRGVLGSRRRAGDPVR